MGNMSYCRFTNTLQVLRDCYENMEEESDLSSEEKKSREKLIALCSSIHGDYGHEGKHGA